MGRNNQQRRAAKARDKARSRGDGVPGAAFGAGVRRGLEDGIRDVESGPPAPPPLTPEEDTSRWVATALQALDRERTGHFDGACARVCDLAATSSGRRTVTATLSRLLTDVVTQAWRLGWQPADLHRFAGRRLGSPEQAVLGDAMAVELSRYAAATIEPRWLDQLSELSATTWWRADTNPVAARAAVHGMSSVVAEAIRVLHLLGVIPQLERLDPLPGTASVHRSARQEAADVDEKILTRVRLLLAKAESTPYEAEAETFTAGAQALMSRHSIDAAMLAAGGGPGAGEAPRGRRLGIDRPYERPKALLLTVVANANRCRTVWSEGMGFVTVIGFTADLQAVETIFTSLLLQSTRAMRSEGTRTYGNGQSRTRSFRSSFLMAFAHRIGERLRDVAEHETQAASQRMEPVNTRAGTTGGGELVRVLAARSEEVEAATDAMFPRLVSKAVGSAQDGEGWYAGRRAADRASLFGADQVAAPGSG